MSELLAATVARAVNGELVGTNVPVTGVCTLDRLLPGHLGFIRATTPERVTLAFATPGAILLVPPDMRGALPGPHIVVANPRLAFGIALEQFFAPPKPRGIAETARIADDAVLHDGVSVGEYVVIGPGCEVGAHTQIRHHVVLSHNVHIGKHCVVKSHAVIGEEGFATEQDEHGNNQKIVHVGGVQIADHVEIGATSVICAGTIDPTEIGPHTKIDDNVFVAHNCRIGANCHLIATSEISGSVVMGDNVWVGPSVTIVDNVTIGDDAFFGIGAVVVKDCEGGMVYVGNPAKPLRPRT